METLELDWVRLVTKSKQETAIDGVTSKATSYLELNCLLPADTWWFKNKEACVCKVSISLPEF